MTPVFGYLTTSARPDEQVAHRRYARSTATRAAVERSGALCAGDRAHSTGETLLALKGIPIWRGVALRDDNEQQILADICQTYADRGTDVLARLDGHFALALVQPAARACLLAVDRMGIERMTYANLADGVVFGTSAFNVSGFPSVGRSIRNQALFDFLFMHMVPAPETVYEGVSKLPAAYGIAYVDGKVELRRYWQPRYEYQHDFAKLKAQLRDSLATAVTTSGLDEHTGAFLSGGLDSSTVTGFLAKQSKGPAKTFSVGFSEEEYDELEYARISNKHFGCEAHEYYVTPKDIVDVFLDIARAYDEPFGNSSAVPTYYCAKFAKEHGVDHLLAGDGGDELFAGNERYAKQRVFDLYGRLPGSVRKFVLEPLARRFPADSGPWPLRKLRSYIDQASVPLPDRFETWNFVYREGRERFLDPSFAAAVDLDGPLRTMRSVWENAPATDLVDKMLWYDWRFTLADNDLRKVGTMCELAGVRVSYPMLHSAVVDLSTRVPPRLKMRRLELRSFFREAMSDFLPAETLEKKKHGFGLPFGLWLKTDEKLRDLIYGLLSDLGRRKIISAAFLADLVDQHRTGHASYYGYVMWSLAMLEAWTAQHES